MDLKKYKLLLVAGARPNFMKIAPIIRILKLKGQHPKVKDSNGVEYKLVHTGQHYDYEMSQTFFNDLEIPKPNHFLEAGSGSHAEQTARIMTGFEKVCEREMPDMVVVVGDVNSTLACSIVAKKLMIPVAHVEAGLRSFDMTMPEEINRMVTDAISDYFFVTEKSAVDNLIKEGKAEKSIHFVGHVMIDNLLYQLKKLETIEQPEFQNQSLKQELNKYIFLTLHRPANVDHRETLSDIVSALNRVAEMIPIVFPVHPRTAKMLKYYKLILSEKIYQLSPLGFQESLYFWKDAIAVITDSGGIQEETTALGVPCLTLRDNTERPITVSVGTNKLVSVNEIEHEIDEILKGNGKKGIVPYLWDGKAAERIVEVFERIEKS